MIKNVGLVDFDPIANNKYIAPNYDLGLTYAYLKQDPNISVKLVTSLNENNLDRYDKLYIFKMSKLLPHPSGLIKNYYNRNISEYGPGFINRERRPYFKETYYLQPDFTCYNPILSFSVNNPKHYYAWKVGNAIKSKHHQQVRLFEEYEGEYLRRDFPQQYKKLVVHDDPNILFNNSEQLKTVNDLINQGYHLTFIQQLDISLLTDTNIIERVITDSNLATLRKRLVISQWNSQAEFFITYCLSHKCKKLDVVVLYEKGKNDDYYLRSMLTLNYYNNLTNYMLRLRPYWDKAVVMKSPLTHCLYRFLYETPYLMSFYEYVFCIACRNLKVPKDLIRTDEETYDFILSKYGMDDLLIELEDWLISNPEYEEHVFIGGSSKYEKQRRKAYDARRSKYAFGTSPNGIS